jgi:hypothetical protein
MTTPGFHPTHVVPQDGLPAWEAPDPSRPTVPLDALLPVRLVDRRGDWGRVICANGWSAWVDGRLLVAVPPDPPAAGGAPAREKDPRPLLARAEDTVGRYRSAVEDLAEGRLDGEAFRGRTQGVRIGLVVDGESLWLYDADHEQWLYCDGARLSTYAAVKGPAAAAPEPTRVVREQDRTAVREPAREQDRTAVREPAREQERTAVREPAQEPSDHEPSDHEPSDHEPSDHEPSDHEPSDHEPSDHAPTRLVRPVTPDE